MAAPTGLADAVAAGGGGVGVGVGVGVGLGVGVGVVTTVAEVTTVAAPPSALDRDKGGRPERLSFPLGGGGARPRIAEGGAELSPMC